MQIEEKLPKVTIDQLAVMIAKGFKGVDERFDRLEKKFDDLDDIVRNDHGLRIRKIEKKLQIA